MVTGDREQLEQRLLRTQRFTALVVGSVAALALVLLLTREDPLEKLLYDPEVREEAVRELVASAGGVWDAHPDADVGRVLKPWLDGAEYAGSTVDTNQIGMREEVLTWPKPADTVRVVFLGDSYVFGFGIAAEERMGVFLRPFLESRSTGFGGRIECLHFGVPSWNVVAEASYLRRQLASLAPDLVVHVVVPNDLNDCTGVRGFGAAGNFSPQVRLRAQGLVHASSVPELWGLRVTNPLLFGFDRESRKRYERAAGEIARLAEAVEASGGRYLLLAKWTGYLPLVRELLAPSLRDDQLAYVSDAFARNPDHHVAHRDFHWNARAHERIARLVYGLATQRDLLPRLGLSPWPEADREVREIHERGARLAADREAWEERLDLPEVGTQLEFGQPLRETARQVYGGIDGDGLVSPYASLVLRRGDSMRIGVEGLPFGLPELAGARARVFVEEALVGELPLDGRSPFVVVFSVPAELADRTLVNVRFESDDYVYPDPALRHCASFGLRRVGFLD